MDASISSMKLCGRIFDASPTAIPSTPCASKSGKFNGQCYGFSVTAVIGKFPCCGTGIENHFKGKFGKSGFDIPRCCSAVSGENIAPVALGIDQQVFLSQLHQGISDGGIPMRMVLHGLADDIGNLVVPAILNLPHGMKNPALNRLKTVIDMRNSPFENYIGSIIEKPVLVLAGQFGYMTGANVMLVELISGFRLRCRALSSGSGSAIKALSSGSAPESRVSPPGLFILYA